MVDSLPLIPVKDAPCTDVRSVLRSVFRDGDYLPPLSIENKSLAKTDFKDCTQLGSDYWVNEYKAEIKDICNREDEIEHLHAERVARAPLPNIFKLHEPTAAKPLPTWSLNRGLLHRRDLVPAIEQNAGRDGALRVQNILNASSCDIRDEKTNTSEAASPIALDSSEIYSLQTFSIGPVVQQQPPPVPHISPPPLSPNYVICVPPQLDFLNCTVGQVNVQSIRLINVSKFECRLSVTPPKRPELEVVITSARGLTITSGARAELSVRFKPTVVRVVTDTLVVRVSCGQIFVIPILCYMQPPVLEITIPHIDPPLTPVPGRTQVEASLHGSDVEVVELGTQLVGDVHCLRVFLHCASEHASFFIVTEDAWLNWNVDCLSARGSVVCEPFCLWPAWWAGGGAVRACAWCLARSPGAHSAALRVISSTAIARPLRLLADLVYFTHQHLLIQGHEKDYDICSDDDPACQYYVNLGSTFPHRFLSATINLVNTSSVLYNYYWTVRRWGVCDCWEEALNAQVSTEADDNSDRLCIGAQESKRMADEDPEAYAKKNEPIADVRVEPAQAEIGPRSTSVLRVRVPSVGGRYGVQRAVLRLIVKDIPKESFPDGYDPIILNTTEVHSVPIPGFQEWTREVCEVLCAEAEVWWEVVPLRFTLMPPVVPLHHSRRLSTINVRVAACQLLGRDRSRAAWVTPAHVESSPPPPVQLGATECVASRFTLPLPCLPNNYPQTDIYTLVAAGNEFKSDCIITRLCETRHPNLRPALTWLGVVAPKTYMQSVLSIENNTYQNIYFWCKVFRWLGENPPSAACVRRGPCRRCQEAACTCALLSPTRGALPHAHCATIHYGVNAPDVDGCVATVVQMRRCEAELAQAAGTEARAALVAYRVLAPRLLLRALPCGEATRACDAACALDACDGRGLAGASLLRPRAALAAGRRACYRLRLTNVTPLPTAVRFQPQIDGVEFIKAKFIPNEFDVRSFGEVEIRVVLLAVQPCERRVCVVRADVQCALRPLYLVIDAAVAGVEVSVQVPTGGGIDTDEFVIMRRTQREVHRTRKRRFLTPHEIFAEEDRKRAVIKANVCRCHITMQYIPPVKRPSPPLPEGEYAPVEIVTRPPSFTRVCRCFPHSKPHLFIPDPPQSISLEFRNIALNQVYERRVILRNESVVTAHWSTVVRRWPRRDSKRTIDTVTRPPSFTRVCRCFPHSKPHLFIPDPPQSISLEFRNIALNQVYERRVILRNESVVTAHWSTVVRRWPRRDSKRTIDTDAWSRGVCAPGVALAVHPPRGVLGARALAELRVQLYADCWGLYTDQILIQVDNVDPIVLDVWIEVVGSPMQFKIQPVYKPDELPSIWLSRSDLTRTLAATNSSRSDLLVHAFVTHDSEHVQDVLPFRLYMRMFDVLPRTCRCVTAGDAELCEQSTTSTSSSSSDNDLDMDTGVELYLAPDYGLLDDTYYTVSPKVCTIKAGQQAEWEVMLEPPSGPETAPNASLVFRLMPLNKIGPGWWRSEPAPQRVRVRQAPRVGRLALSSRELLVHICALDLPYGDFLRVRKRFQVLNVGNGELKLSVQTCFPWCVVQGSASHHLNKNRCAVGCEVFPPDEQRLSAVTLDLPPRSSTEVCVEVCVSTLEAWPSAPPYAPRRRHSTPLFLYDDTQLLQTLPLIVDMEYPEIKVEPKILNFGFVTDGDTRKSYISVSHTNSTKTLTLAVRWKGSEEFKFWPRFIEVAPGCSERVYLQYTAVWRRRPAEGCLSVHVMSGAAGWCGGEVAVRGAAVLDHKWRAPPHDHTDDTHLRPDHCP